MSRIKLLTFVIKKDAIDKLLVFQMVGILGGEEGGVEGVAGGERGCWVLRFSFGSEILCKRSYSNC